MVIGNIKEDKRVCIVPLHAIKRPNTQQNKIDCNSELKKAQGQPGIRTWPAPT